MEKPFQAIPPKCVSFNSTKAALKCCFEREMSHSKLSQDPSFSSFFAFVDVRKTDKEKTKVRIDFCLKLSFPDQLAKLTLDLDLTRSRFN